MEPVDRREAAWKEFQEIWRELLDDLETPGTAVLVEGERDRRSITRLGVRAPVHLVHQGQSLAELAGSLGRETRRLVVLTDWDRSGGQFARKVRDLLGPAPVEVDLDIRRRLAHALRGEVVHVEGLAGWAVRLSERHGLSLDRLLDPEVGIRPPTG